MYERKLYCQYVNCHLLSCQIGPSSDFSQYFFKFLVSNPDVTETYFVVWIYFWLQAFITDSCTGLHTKRLSSLIHISQNKLTEQLATE